MKNREKSIPIDHGLMRKLLDTMEQLRDPDKGCPWDKNQTFKSFIKEMVFIIKEHSGYAITHPKDKDNVIRHLKHACHALDPTTIKERPMPAPEIGLTKAIKRYLTKSKVKPIYITIDSLADEFIKLCKETVYSPNRNYLLPLAKKINSKFTLLYNKL